MFFNVLFGVLYFGAFLVAALGAIGLFSLLLLDGTHWAVRWGVWLVSILALVGLISVAAFNRWGPFDLYACSRSRPCPQQPAPTIRVQLDLPGTPTPEDCTKAVREKQAAGELPSNATIEVACS